jgi:1-acyl-sn-glycerol-3-phosphate acyltransferase
LTAQGTEHVPARGSVILAVNHVSALDPFVVGSVFDRPLRFMAKEELFRSRLLRMLFSSLGAYPVRRDRADIGSIKQTLGHLRRGEVVLMFPEGTRGDGTTLGPVRPGVAILAARAHVPVIPVYHEGMRRVLPRGARVPRPHPVRVFVGPPMQPAPSVLTDSAAAEAFGQRLCEQWAMLREQAAGVGGDRGQGPKSTTQTGSAHTPRAREEARPV